MSTEPAKLLSAQRPVPPPVRAGHGAALLVLALLLPPVLTAVLHFVALQPWAVQRVSDLLRPAQALRSHDTALQPPAHLAQGLPQALPFFEPASAAGQPAPTWLLARVRLERPAAATWTLALGHRTPVLVYLDGRLLANSVAPTEADLLPRNLQIGERWLSVSVPADWLGVGEHEIAVRISAAGPAGASLTGLALGPADAMERADRPRRFWFALRAAIALSALLISAILMLAWLVERQERLFVLAGLQLLMLALLLSPYVLEVPLLPAPWWRMLLDAADVLAKGLAPVVLVAWAAGRMGWVRRVALVYLALALPVDLLAAFHVVPWVDFGHPWPWWALSSRLLMLALAVVVAARAWLDGPDLRRLGTVVLAGLALWVWVDVSLFAIVLPGVVAVVDFNVLAYAGWTLWAAMLLHRRLVDNRQHELRLRSELADQLAQRSDELRAQYVALQASEQARTAAAERERLLQEMHDGVGAQLASAKMLASGGQLSSSEMVDALDACLREMRLTVDALSVTDGDLALLLATLRHRLEPALRAGGITLDWQVDEAPRVPALMGTGGRELARIVQEALANTMHHADATRVTVATRLLAPQGCVQLRVEDNGRGMPAELTPGRGLRNMRQRAARLGARIDWRRPAGPGTGTEMVLELPLRPGVTACD